MDQWGDLIRLSKLLEAEWRGAPVDCHEVRELAGHLLARHPEIRNVLGSVQRRMAGA
ncbi:MAG: hypothetical protein ACM33T_15745 [Solirubrobacterales bacterium]